MKLNQDSVWTVKPCEIKILKTIEHLSNKYETVPFENIKKLNKDNLNVKNILVDLCKDKFLRYEAIPYLGYRMTTSGYDCLAISFLRRNGLEVLGDKIGIGKESDIFYGRYKGRDVALKFHRLGRTSFRTVKNNRDYHGTKKNLSWFELSKKSAEEEFKYLNMFKETIRVPIVYEQNRHVVVMEYLENYVPLYTVKDLFEKDKVYCELMHVIESLYKKGFVHGDFNEFNIMINENEEIITIDLPQCINLDNPRAFNYLKRDYEAIIMFFEKKFRYTNDYQIDIIELQIK
ncbi:Serine/threonine-protein kinase rio2 [Gurleya vavrai]